MNEALSRRLMIITAPAGCGKTSAVLKWLENVPLPFAWLSLDVQENSPILLWRYICAALDNSISVLCKDASCFISSQPLSDANNHIGIMAESVLKIGFNFLFILDDFQLITNDAILNAFSYYINHMPPNMHLVLISRSDPRLRFTKLEIKDDLVMIGPEDLCFTAEEIDAFFKERGCFLQKEEIRKIESYTEGWAAAVTTVAISLKDDARRHHLLSSFGSSSRRIDKYLAEEVFPFWTPEQQEFMMQTAILDRLCGDLCHSLTGFDGDRLLKELLADNSFLITLDDKGSWLRYHPLFSDFLKRKLMSERPSLLNNLYHKAGIWYKEHGFVSDAIEQFLLGYRFEEAAVLIEMNAASLIRQKEYASVMAWLDKLPEDYVRNSIMISMIKATYYANSTDYKNAWRYVTNAEALINPICVSSKPNLAAVLIVKSNLFYMSGDIDSALATIEEGVSLGVPNLVDRSFWDFNAYETTIYRTSLKTFARSFRENPDVFRSYIAKYQQIVSASSGYAPLVEGEFYYEINSFAQALPKLLMAADLAITDNCAGSLIPATVTLAKIRHAYGDTSGALGIIENIERKMDHPCKARWINIIKAYKARLYIDSNDFEMVDRWMAENKLSDSYSIKTHEYEFLVMARAFIAKSRTSDAEMLLNRLLIHYENQKMCHGVVEVTNLLAISSYKEMEEDRALYYLEKALSIGMEEGYVRLFVDELSPMVSLLELYMRSQKRKGRLIAYAIKLLAQTRIAARRFMIPTQSPLLEDLLTPAEKKVLSFILKAYTNNEIAEELGIVLSTVKVHTSSIYKKLGVKNRTQCIQKVFGTKK